MGALSDAEQQAEAEFLNPLTNQVANAMKSVIKQKVHSALCNEETIDKAKKAMYEGKFAVFDKELKEMVMIA